MHLIVTLAIAFLIQTAPPADAPSVASPPAAKEETSTKLSKLLGANLEATDGKKIKTADAIKGKKNIVLYFTAGWCGPCRRFTPSLVKYVNEHKDSKDFIVIMVGSDRDAAAQKKYMKQYEMPYYAVPFNKNRLKMIKKAYGGGGIPNLVILEPDGNVVKGSYETDGKYSPKNRNSYIGPDKVLSKLKELVKANENTKA